MSESQRHKRNQGMEKYFFRAASVDLKGLPGAPVAYWISKNIISTFQKSDVFSEYAEIGKGLDTGNNNLFLRLWYEVDWKSPNWRPCQKGGSFRKWYGNNDYFIKWDDDGRDLKNYPGSNLRNSHNYFKQGISWTRVSSASTAFRYFPEGSIFESTGPSIFPKRLSINFSAAFLNSCVTLSFLRFMAPTLDFQSGHISALPIIRNLNLIDSKKAEDVSERCIQLSRQDWDSYEVSWDFRRHALFNYTPTSLSIRTGYDNLRVWWKKITLEMQRLEEENNRIFIEAYGLQDELTPEVPLKEITLTCNPHYRYGGDKTEEELEALLLADTMRELVSYSVGCMFGRYSLDKPGLILANQGDTLEDYLAQIPEPTFLADKDNVIPMLDGDWFTDDIVDRFRKFLRVAFGEEHYEENLRFVEESLNIKGKRSYTIRDYFLSEFYADHVKRYKKRPIYWMFSSPKGTFNALIYMHRYRPDTVSVVLNDYLREFRSKLVSHKSHLEAVSISGSASQAEKTRALKEIDRVGKMIAELEEYERDVLYPLAIQNIQIDLDDGVKANYPKFGTALKKIVGLEAKEDD